MACNKEIKFGLFLEKALGMGADYIATGHYVRMENVGGEPRLFAAEDKGKDQSYFLWTLGQRQLRHCLFPGGYLKSKVREMAREAGLPTAGKKDSQGICFIGKVTVADFLSAYIPESRGAVLNTEGDVLGEHRGAQFYTIGQRHLGVNLYQPRRSRSLPAETKPFYVVEKDVHLNAVIVAEGDENPALYRTRVALSMVSAIRSYHPEGTVPVMARVRYRQPLSSARLTFGPESSAELVSKSRRNSSHWASQPCSIPAKGRCWAAGS